MEHLWPSSKRGAANNLVIDLIKNDYRQELFIKFATEEQVDLVLGTRNADFMGKIIMNLHVDNRNTLVKNLVNQRGENTLHQFASSDNFRKVLDEMRTDSNVDLGILSGLLISKNKANDSPLMVAIPSSTMLANDLWSLFEECCALELINASDLQIGQPNSRKANILHLCALAKNHQLMIQICRTKIFQENDILSAFNILNSPLIHIKDEMTLLDILEIFPLENFDLLIQKDLFRVACRLNFVNIVILYRDNLPPKHLLEIIEEKDEFKNNALMIAANNSSDLVLMFLITSVFYSFNDLQKKDDCLHGKNGQGQTLLRVVMDQGDPLAIARDVLIKMERDFHREQRESCIVLAQCFQNNLGPSKFVGKAMKDEKNYHKSTLKAIIKTWVVCFLIFLVPFSIYSFDVVTDVKLAEHYHRHIFKENETLIANCSMCLNTLNKTTNDLVKIMEIPKQLEPYPSFNYMIAFILLPIACHSIEWYCKEGGKMFDQVRLLFIFL